MSGGLEHEQAGGNIQDWHYMKRHVLYNVALFCCPILQPRPGLFTIKDSCSPKLKTKKLKKFNYLKKNEFI